MALMLAVPSSAAHRFWSGNALSAEYHVFDLRSSGFLPYCCDGLHLIMLHFCLLHTCTYKHRALKV